MSVIQINLADLFGKVEAIQGGAAQFAGPSCGQDCDCLGFLSKASPTFIRGARAVDQSVVAHLTEHLRLVKHQIVDAEISAPNSEYLSELNAQRFQAEALLDLFKVTAAEYDKALEKVAKDKSSHLTPSTPDPTTGTVNTGA